jgi:hypothetical protein
MAFAVPLELMVKESGNVRTELEREMSDVSLQDERSVVRLAVVNSQVDVYLFPHPFGAYLRYDREAYVYGLMLSFL